MRRDRNHFLRILYQYLEAISADHEGKNAKVHSRVAYALRNLPGILSEENWTVATTAAAWAELEEQARMNRCMAWLADADAKAAANRNWTFPKTPEDLVKAHIKRLQGQLPNKGS